MHACSLCRASDCAWAIAQESADGVQSYSHGLRASGRTAMLASGACVRSIAHTLAYVCVTVLACACACMCVCACSGARVCVNACVRARACVKACVRCRAERRCLRSCLGAGQRRRVVHHARHLAGERALRVPFARVHLSGRGATCNVQHATRSVLRGQTWVGRVPVQMWQGRAQSCGRCGSGGSDTIPRAHASRRRSPSANAEHGGSTLNCGFAPIEPPRAAATTD
jgi:hypothetical protein